MNKKQKHFNGFSLIEFMIVVGTLIFIAAILLPGYVSSRSEAKILRIQSVLGQIRVAVLTNSYPKREGSACRIIYPDLVDQAWFKDSKIPKNPLNGLRSVKAWRGEVNGTSGWLYDRQSGKVWLNAKGYAPSGEAWQAF